MSFRETKFPRYTCMFYRRATCCTCTTIVSGNQDVICFCFRNTSSDCANTRFRSQFNGNTRIFVDTFQVVNQLCQVFDGVNIMMRWWRYELNTWSGVTSLGNFRIYFFAWQLTAFTWLSALSTFDLQFFCMNEVVCGYPKTTRCNLFYFGIHTIAVWQWFKTIYIFAAFTRVRCGA